MHLAEISVLRVQFLDEGTKRSRLGVDLVSKVADQAVQAVIRGFSSRQPLRLVAVIGRPERTSSPKLLRPRLHSAAQNFTVVNDGAESSYT
ncbi:hypothetical protein TNCV_3333911 [Trichonephila clavipes]|nr:hypothetical protein TNCV_3333911 [Trichonephila clavipes]